MPLIDLANPSRFLALSGRILPWLSAATLIAFANPRVSLALFAAFALFYVLESSIFGRDTEA